MRILIFPALEEEAIKLVQELEKRGHAVWALDWRRPQTEQNSPRYIWADPRNADVLKTIFKFINPQEVHNFVTKSYQANFNLILASHKVKRLVFYFGEKDEELDQTVEIWAKKFGFIYESK